MSRTGLSAADLSAQFRDVCGDGSMEWVYTPMQTWMLLDAADMLDENARLRSCLSDADENARLIMGEVAQLRELVRDYVNAPCTTCDCWDDNFRCWNYDGADCGLVARARELGVEVDG